MRLFLLLIVVLLGGPAYSTEAVVARLIANREQIQKGEPFLIGLHLKMFDGWHTYWENPGFAGQAPKWTFKEVPGLVIGAPQFPWPKVWTDAQGFVSYGYDNETVIFAEATYDGTAAEITLEGKADWVACKEMCIPGHADLKLALPVGTARAPSEDLFAPYLKTSPSANVLPFTTTSSFEIRDDSWTGTVVISPKPGNTLQTEPAPSLLPIHSSDLGDLKHLKWGLQDGNLTFNLNYEAYGPAPADFTLNAALLVHTQTGPVYARVKLYPASEAQPAQATSEAKSVPGPETQPTTETEPNPVSTSEVPTNAAGAGSIWFYILLAFLGGIILNLMPCVLPVLSLKIFSLLKETGADSTRRIGLGWVYTVGIIACFNLLAMAFIIAKTTGEELGIGFQFQSPEFVIAISALILVMALSFMGVFEIGQPTSDKLQNLSMRSGYQGAFFQGVLMTILSTPCTAPLLGAAYGWAIVQTNLVMLVIFNVIGFGLAFPYLCLCYAPALLKFLPKPGPWMATFKVTMGFLMLGTLIWLFYVLSDLTGTSGITGTMTLLLALGAACYVYGKTWYSEQRTRGLLLMLALVAVGGYIGMFRLFDITDPKAAKREALEFQRLKVLAEQGSESTIESFEKHKTTLDKIAWVPYSESTLEHFRGSNRLIFVDFTAAWCTTCKVNERTVIDTEAIRSFLANNEVVTLKADYTDKDDKLTETLKKFQRAGVPLYLVYAGQHEPTVLPELLTRDMLLKALTEAKALLEPRTKIEAP